MTRRPPSPTLFPYTTLFRSAGTPPEELHTSATVTFQPGEGITKVALAVEGRVPGIDENAFQEAAEGDRKSTRLNSSHVKISYAVFCLKKKKNKKTIRKTTSS